MFEVYRDIAFSENVAGDATTTVGTFDGVHLGHRKILEHLGIDAKSQRIRTVVTFEPHPQTVTHSHAGSLAILTNTDEKIQLLRSGGADRIFILKFDRKLAQLPAEDFVKSILIKRLRTKRLVVGYNHSFGRGRAGNLEFLEAHRKRFEFELEVVAPFYLQGESVSSTKIRQLLLSGDVERARHFLDRPYALSGVVITGFGMGHQINYPTANLKLTSPEKLVPLRGVYAVAVELERDYFPGMLNIGTRPTFGEGETTIEVHLINFVGDLYGKTIRMLFLKRLRDEKRYSSAADLQGQLLRDRQESLNHYREFSEQQVGSSAR
ncbi:MAG: bifunctional riboflavin kinase/FAD synthetase [bacterium]